MSDLRSVTIHLGYTNACVECTYSLEIVLEGNVCVPPFESVVGSVVPSNVINPVGFVVVPKRKISSKSS